MLLDSILEASSKTVKDLGNPAGQSQKGREQRLHLGCIQRIAGNYKACRSCCKDHASANPQLQRYLLEILGKDG